MAEMMKGWLSLTDSQKTSVADVFDASQRLNNVANDLLIFSSTGDNAGFEEDLLDFNIRDVIDSVIGKFIQQAESAGLNIYINIPSNVVLGVFGAKGRLIRVLEHLVSNATKFTPAGYIMLQVCVLSSFSADFFLCCEVVYGWSVR